MSEVDGAAAWTAEEARVLGAAIRTRRHAAGLSQEDLAHASGLTRNHLALIESGRSSARDAQRPANPRVSTLAAIAAALDVPVVDLVPAFEGPPKPVVVEFARSMLRGRAPR